MNIIKVFIASSAELKRERLELVDLLADLDEEIEEQGIKLKPELWEYMDSSMGVKRKEDEYLEKLRDCEICIVLFWRTLGEYTVEELDVAVAEMHANRLPKKVYVLFKEPCDNISFELAEFKGSFSQKYPHIPTFSFEDNNKFRNTITTIIKIQEI